jgi:hypothetical protein
MKQLVMIGSMVMALVGCALQDAPASSEATQDEQTTPAAPATRVTPDLGIPCLDQHWSCVNGPFDCRQRGGHPILLSCEGDGDLNTFCCSVD